MNLSSSLGLWDHPQNPTAPLTESQRTLLLNLSNSKINEESSFSESPKDNGFKSQSNETFSSASTLAENDGVIETNHQFMEWFQLLESQMMSDEDVPLTNMMTRLSDLTLEIDSYLAKIQNGLKELSSLENKYNQLSSKTNSLHESCQILVRKQNEYEDFKGHVNEILIYFSEADKISQKLTSSSLSVNSEAFVSILKKIDEGALFMDQNVSFKQSGSYRVKYNALLSRSLSLIKNYFRKSLDSVSASMNNSSSSSSELTLTIYDSKFRSISSKVFPIMEQVQIRASSENPLSPFFIDYETLLNDSQNFYFEIRKRILRPSLEYCLQELVSHHTRDSCSLFRKASSSLYHLCEDEYKLYLMFFTTSHSESLVVFLEDLCQLLYDTLRPLIIHLNHLETLSELTDILRSEMLGHYCSSHPIYLKPFEKIISQLLGDVQERLVYRAHMYIRTDISGYVPAPGDLAYPEKLEMMEAISDSLEQQSQNLHNSDSVSSSLSSSHETSKNETRNLEYSKNSPADMHGMWYPSLRRTLVCLSKLYRSLDKSIFQGLSYEALLACMDSLHRASIEISHKSSSKDGFLFEIKHLLILREQISPFQIDVSFKELSLDFSKLKSAALSLFNTKMNSSNSLLSLLLEGTPEVTEKSLDYRKEVDKQLKTICENFISSATTLIVGPLNSFLFKGEEFKKTHSSFSLNKVGWAKASELQLLVSSSLRTLKQDFPLIQRSMQLYLANKETEFILFRPLRNNVTSAFINLLGLIRSDYNGDEQIIIGCPSQEQIVLLVSSLQLSRSKLSKKDFETKS